jgi:hypothetical protein
LPVCLGFETRQSLASNPTQNPSGSIWQRGLRCLLRQKRASFACPFLLINPAKRRGYFLTLTKQINPDLADFARESFRIMPMILGNPDPKDFLVEKRPANPWITNTAFLKADILFRCLEFFAKLCMIWVLTSIRTPADEYYPTRNPDATLAHRWGAA